MLFKTNIISRKKKEIKLCSKMFKSKNKTKNKHSYLINTRERLDKNKKKKSKRHFDYIILYKEL